MKNRSLQLQTNQPSPNDQQGHGIIACDIKSFLFSNGLISDHQFGFKPGHSTLDTCCFCFPNNGWRSSMPNVRSEPSTETYHDLSTLSGTATCSQNSLRTVSKATSTHGSKTSSPVAVNVWPLMEFSHPLFLSRLEFLKILFWAQCFFSFSSNYLDDSLENPLSFC